MDVDREVGNADCEPTWVDGKTDPAQPQATSSGPKAAGRSLNNAKGTFLSVPTVAEVQLAHKDLQRILKPPHHNRQGFKDLELDILFKEHLEGMKQFMWTYIDPNSGLTD